MIATEADEVDEQWADVKKLHHIVRTPTWIPPPWRQAQVMAGRGQMLKEIAVDDKENFTAEQIQKFHDDEEFYQKFVRSIEKDTGSNFHMVWLPVYLLPSRLKVQTSLLTRATDGQGRRRPGFCDCENERIHAVHARR